MASSGTRKERQDYIYRDCTRVRTPPVSEVNEELVQAVGRDYRVMPSFEKTLFEYIHIRHYSIIRNEYLGCRWKQFIKNVDKRLTEPYTFPDDRDLHFHNHCVRFLPSESTVHKKRHPYQLKPGPGVDEVGQKPIPNELIMKRFKSKKVEEDKAKKTTKRDVQNLHKKEIK